MKLVVFVMLAAIVLSLGPGLYYLSRESSIFTIVSAVGTAIKTRIIIGMVVQITSAVVLCEKFVGDTTFDLRCLNSEMIITLKTMMAMATHHQKIIM